MHDTVLTLILPADLAEAVTDLLLQHSDLVQGFTTSNAFGHGESVPLRGAAELVGGHAPRRCIQTTGAREQLRQLLAAIKHEMPQARIYYWLQDAIEVGYL